MAPEVNTRILFSEVPKGYPDPEKVFKVDRSQTFNVDSVQLNGGIAVKILVLSIDPYLRHRMRAPGTSEYNSPPFTIGQPIENFGVAVVLRSDDPSVSAGDHLCGVFSFAEYAVLPNASNYQKVYKPSASVPWSAYVGVLGWPGKTSYYGYLEFVRDYAKKGDTFFVTSGAGPVGSFVIQIAKEHGLKVIASAGSEEKVAFMKECGADVAFNYKTTSTKEILARHGPIHFYWDHVGGESLDLALETSAPFARIIIVGLIAGYNQQHAPLKNYPHILFKSLTVQGFVVNDLEAKYGAAFYAEVPPKVASGAIKHLEYVKRGIENAGEVVADVQTGKNLGKAILIVADE